MTQHIIDTDELEKLAIEHLSRHTEYSHYKDEGTIVYTPSLKQLEAFAKAYLNKWLKEQDVVGWGKPANGDVITNLQRRTYQAMYNTDYYYSIPLIALPSEVK